MDLKEKMNRAWDVLYEQAQGMDSDSLCEYFAEGELKQMSEEDIDQLLKDNPEEAGDDDASN